MPQFTPVHYRGYTITYDPPPIPIRTCDFHFLHDDFCCPECDNRGGSAGSVLECMEQIDEIEEERGIMRSENFQSWLEE
jgi:hypothetical protein